VRAVALAIGLILLGGCGADSRPPCTDFDIEFPGTSWQLDWPPLAWNGSEYGLGYGVGEDELDLFGTSVDDNGQVGASWPEELSGESPLGLPWKGMVWTGSSYVLVQSDWASNGIVTVLDPSGARLGPDIIMPGLRFRGGQPLWNGSSVTIVWYEDASSVGGGWRFWLQDVSASGVASGPPTEIALADGTYVRTAAWNGTGVSLLAQVTSGDMHTIRVSSSGAITTDTVVATTPPFDTATLAIAEGDDVVAYVDSEGLQIARVHPDGTTEAPVLVESLPEENFHLGPALGWTGEQLVYFTNAYLPDGHSVSTMRILDRDGVPIAEPEELVRSPSGAAGAGTIVASEDRVAVTWTTYVPGSDAAQFMVQRCF
jgi:hypothetical protein